MFTGIVTDIGTVAARDRTKLKIASHYEPASMALGASIACDGCCLTVTAVKEGADGGAMFEVDVSNETAARTTLGSLETGEPHQSRAPADFRLRARRPSDDRSHRRIGPRDGNDGG